MMANSECIQVESRNVGRIIGSRGSKIRELQDESEAQIQVSREAGPDGQTDVTISGTGDQIERAKQLIEQCLSRDSYGGGGGQRGGRRNFQNNYGSERDDWRGSRGNDGDDGNGWGKRGGFDSRDNRQGDWGGRSDRGGAGFGGYSNDSRDDNSGYSEGRSFGGRGRGGRGGGGGGGFFRGQEDGNKEEIYILTNEVGRLIGSGGSKIKELQSDSNCKIKVSRDGCNGTNMVELFGSPDEIREAKSLIAKTVEIVEKDGSRLD